MLSTVVKLKCLFDAVKSPVNHLKRADCCLGVFDSGLTGASVEPDGTASVIPVAWQDNTGDFCLGYISGSSIDLR